MSTDAGAGMRTPPRFVPTLTEVVDVPEGLLPTQRVGAPRPAAEPQPEQPGLADPMEPVLEAQVGLLQRADALLWSDAPSVQPQADQPLQQPEQQPVQETTTPVPASQPWPTPDLMEALGVLITEQVMQRLEQRLSILVDQQAALFAEQWARHLTEALSRQLRAEVPGLVQEAVALAVQPTDPGTATTEHQRGFSPIYGTDADSG